VTSLRLAFGPLAYEVELGEGVAVPPWAARHETRTEPLRRVVVERVASLPEASGKGDFADEGFLASHGAGAHRVLVAAGREARWGAALAALVAHDAPSVGALVVHCAAVRVDGGVALLLAKGGTGKTTFARNAGARSFAHNAVIADAKNPDAVRVWALPFAGDPRPDLDAEGAAPVRVVALLERGEAPGFEWIPRAAATIPLARSCVRAPAADPWARERFMLALALAAKVAVGRIRTTRGPRDLEPLDAALCTENPR
jgi:hypothetical protein